MMKSYIRKQARFRDIQTTGADRTIPLLSQTVYEEERDYISEALTAGKRGRQAEMLAEAMAERTGRKYAVPLSSGNAAMHLALKLAAERLYGSASGISTPDGLGRGGALSGRRVFCPDMASSSAADPIVYEGGEPVFLDCESEYLTMDPEVLELAFERYPEVKLVILSHTYGYPGRVTEIQELCRAHGALLIEDASESLGARVRTKTEEGKKLWLPAGHFGDYAVLDFGAGRIVSGGTGGMLLTDDLYSAKKAEHWASGSNLSVPWRQHEELGYDYQMNDFAAASIRGQLLHLGEQIEARKAVYLRYLKEFDAGILVRMMQVREDTEPNYWISCMYCDSNLQFREVRNERRYCYSSQNGTASPMEIYDALGAFDIESAPIYKPMSLQPFYQGYEQITLDGSRRCYTEFYNDTFWLRSNSAKDYYESGLCLPSGADLTEEEQARITEIVLACFDRE